MIQGIFTKKCVWCGEQGVVQVDETELYNYLRGNPIQDAFKSLTTELREQIISGTHPECWDRYINIDDHFDELRMERRDTIK